MAFGRCASRSPKSLTFKSGCGGCQREMTTPRRSIVNWWHAAESQAQFKAVCRRVAPSAGHLSRAASGRYHRSQQILPLVAAALRLQVGTRFLGREERSYSASFPHPMP